MQLPVFVRANDAYDYDYAYDYGHDHDDGCRSRVGE